jgi:hypothetical protein
MNKVYVLEIIFLIFKNVTSVFDTCGSAVHIMDRIIFKFLFICWITTISSGVSVNWSKSFPFILFFSLQMSDDSSDLSTLINLIM